MRTRVIHSFTPSRLQCTSAIVRKFTQGIFLLECSEICRCVVHATANWFGSNSTTRIDPKTCNMARTFFRVTSSILAGKP
jgi:hypothetical protein